jgi:hypothetical protein
MKNIFWTGYCDEERLSAVHEIEDIIRIHGFVTNSKQFSDVSVSLTIELEEKDVDNLYGALEKCVRLNRVEKLNSTSKTERTIFLNITFTKATGDLRVEVPAVPG